MANQEAVLRAWSVPARRSRTIDGGPRANAPLPPTTVSPPPAPPPPSAADGSTQSPPAARPPPPPPSLLRLMPPMGQSQRGTKGQRDQVVEGGGEHPGVGLGVDKGHKHSHIAFIDFTINGVRISERAERDGETEGRREAWRDRGQGRPGEAKSRQIAESRGQPLKAKMLTCGQMLT